MMDTGFLRRLDRFTAEKMPRTRLALRYWWLWALIGTTIALVQTALRAGW